MTDADDRYLRLDELARYASVSVRTLQRFIADRVHPLPVHRFAGRSVRVKRSEFDAWARDHHAAAAAPAGDVVEASDDEMRIAQSLRGYPVKRR